MPKRRSSDKRFKEISQDIDVQLFRDSVRNGFADFPDPRQTARVLYPAWHLLLVILSGYLAGAHTVADIAHFADLRRDWLEELSGIDGAPAYDTIWLFLVRTEPPAFKALIAKWLRGVPSDLRGQLLVVDGKRLKGVSDSDHVTHVVELFAAESRLTLAQEKVPGKANERAALPALLNIVDVRGALVSLDAFYAYKEVTRQILGSGADYLIGLKGNQECLHTEVGNFFDQALAAGYEGVEVSRSTSEEKGHGRSEQRVVVATQELDWLPQREQWDIKTLIEVRSRRQLGETVEHGVRYYISSREASASEFGGWIRGHWSIENSLHYVLDVIFAEDKSLMDTGHSAENLALLRRLGMNIVRSVDPGRGMADARRCAMYDPKYLTGLLAQIFC